MSRPEDEFTLTETKFGFTWGPLTVQRLVSDRRFGLVIEVSTPTETFELRASPQGRRLSSKRVKRGPTP